MAGMGIAGVGANGKGLNRPAYNGPFSDLNTMPIRPPTNRKPSPGSFGVPVAISNEAKRENIISPYPISFPQPTHSRRSSLQSSPSIYPASLPAFGDDEKAAEVPKDVLTDMPRLPMLRRPLPPPMVPTKDFPKSPSSPPLPPRNPLRASQRLQVRTQQLPLKSIPSSPTTFEPLTPPASLISSSGSASDEGAAPRPFPGSINPFSDPQEERLNTEVPLSPTSPKRRDNFYTRRKLVEVRPSNSLEWKNSN